MHKGDITVNVYLWIVDARKSSYILMQSLWHSSWHLDFKDEALISEVEEMKAFQEDGAS